MSAPHVVILASAGTGKTYQLSGRFIDLLLAGAAQERILATTFTRKAAGEILERVLERLIEAVDSPAERAALAEGRAFGGTFDGEQAQRLLERLAGRLQRFEVRTIDSFFVTLCQVFGTDLDLAPTWALADEYALSALREEALSRVLAEADEQDFADLLRELSAKGAAARRVRATLAEVIKGGRALFLESPAQAWWRVEPPGEPEGLAEALAALEGADLPRTQAGGVMKSWAGARERLVAHAREGSWLEAVKGGFLQKYLAGEECFDKKPIPATLVPVLDVLREAAAHALLTRLDERNRRSRELLERYERVLRALKRERGAYAFDDLPRALAPIETGASGPIEERDLDLSLRLDARIDHLLLDEFQDTAPVQWRVLGPMAEELAADGTGGRSLFCVGDVKQSIYGWRAAEPRLLEALGDALHIEPTRLALNYRSSPVVLGALGRVFGSLGENAALAADGPGPLMLAAERFTATFEEPRAARTLPGAVELREAGGGGEREDSKANQRLVTDLAVERVAAMAAAQPEATIAVLVRNRKPIPALIDALQRKGLPASGEGGNPLVDSAAVLHALSLLHLADHPSDRLAAFHLTSSPFGVLLGEVDPLAGARRLSAGVRRSLVDEGYGPFLASLQPAVDGHPAYGDWDRRRFRQLVELAFTADDVQGLRADRFVDLVRERKVEEPSAARIKVMTVHAAKGLEFDAVVLCQLVGPLTSRRRGFLHARPDPMGPVTFVSTDPARAVCALSPELLAWREAQEAREAQESLSLLYVAMTRARHRLELLVPHRALDKKPSASPAGILRSALCSGGADEQGLLWRHEDSSDAWWCAGEADARGPTPRPAPPFRLAPSDRPRRLPRRSPSAEEGGPIRSGSALLAPPSSAALRAGSLVHRWCEEIEWLETFDPGSLDLLELGREIEPDEERRRGALRLFESALEAPPIRAALARPSATARVWRERTFRVVLGAGAEAQLWSGAFDRVVLEGASGGWERAQVCDFKTDRVAGVELAERAEHYRPQLERYREVLAHLIDLDPARIELRLLFLHAGEVFDL